MIIVWEMLENQTPYLEGREADLFSMLLQVRYCNQVNVRIHSHHIFNYFLIKLIVL